MADSFDTKSALKLGRSQYTVFLLKALAKKNVADISRFPFSIRILLENVLRREDGKTVTRKDIEALLAWTPKKKSEQEIAFTPARVILQDFTGVPAIVDLAAMREKIAKLGGNPKKINPLEPVDLVIDHSVQVDAFGSADAFKLNVKREYERNAERYQFLRWGQQAFSNFRVVPPGTGIVHQVNLEYLAQVVKTKKTGNETLAYPDTLVGTDSHTTMINGLGVLGWGVGGIEAEAAMLGQPVSMLVPEVIGFKMTGQLPEGSTATDLVLTVTQMLRKKGVVGKFVEFYGPGLSHLTLADRATIANMAPEYGATMGFFPVDDETLNYLKLTGRSDETIALAEAYLKEQGLFRTAQTSDPEFSDTLELDLGTVKACLAGPKRPQDRVLLDAAKREFRQSLYKMLEGKTQHLDQKRIQDWLGEGGSKELDPEIITSKHLGALAETADVRRNGDSFTLTNGSVVIAAITSCTNTSNPAVMIGAGLVAKKAAEKGLKIKPWVKTSLAPGSQVVIDYLKATGLLPYLEKLSFNLVGFGCTTCIGNSGPLPEDIGAAVKSKDLVAAAVLSGNRNFEGRINPLVRANYLASPPLVVAYALAGTMDIDLMNEPLGKDSKGNPVYLRDVWPSQKEIRESMKKIDGKMFQSRYANVFEGDKEWKSFEVPASDTFEWDAKSTYVKNPPFFDKMEKKPVQIQDIKNARVLVLLGDSVTTDHISPAGSIAKDSPAGKYLIDQGVDVKDFNSYGARRGNHEVMMRGTFANIRLKNLLVPGTEGGVTKHLPDGKKTSIFEASEQYRKDKIPTLVIAGKEYGAGSSRDWAAKGPALLGVRTAIAESFERIHRSNLIGMGVLPLQFEAGENPASLNLTGEEEYTIEGIADNLKPGKKLKCVAKGHKIVEFTVTCRIDTPVELAYYQNGGILQYVLRQLLNEK